MGPLVTLVTTSQNFLEVKHDPVFFPEEKRGGIAGIHELTSVGDTLVVYITHIYNLSAWIYVACF